MTTWGSASLLTRFNTDAGRPSSGDAITDATKYQFLADAQQYVVADIAARFPESLYPKAAYGSYPTLTTTDNQVFTFGTDANGNALTPIGKVGIYPSLASIPDDPWTEGFDYDMEGNQIRIPNNRTYSGTLYWRGIAPPQDISASVAPSLLPVDSRILIVKKGVQLFAESAGRNPTLAALMERQYDDQFRRYALVWRTQFRSGGALAPLVSSFAANPSWVGGYGSLGGY